MRAASADFPALILVLDGGGCRRLVAAPAESGRNCAGISAPSAIFANNFVLWSEAGYFDGAAELKPLLHLWSLGVEEQFYLIWPLLIWWWWRREVRWLAAIALVVAVSFAMNVMVVADGAALCGVLSPAYPPVATGRRRVVGVLAHDGTPSAGRRAMAVSIAVG